MAIRFAVLPREAPPADPPPVKIVLLDSLPPEVAHLKHWHLSDLACLARVLEEDTVRIPIVDPRLLCARLHGTQSEPRVLGAMRNGSLLDARLCDFAPGAHAAAAARLPAARAEGARTELTVHGFPPELAEIKQWRLRSLANLHRVLSGPLRIANALPDRIAELEWALADDPVRLPVTHPGFLLARLHGTRGRPRIAGLTPEGDCVDDYLIDDYLVDGAIHAAEVARLPEH